MENTRSSVPQQIGRHPDFRTTPRLHRDGVLASHQFVDPAYEGAVIGARRRSNRHRLGRLVTIYRFVRDTAGIGVGTVVRRVIGAAFRTRLLESMAWLTRPALPGRRLVLCRASSPTR